ncbi:FemAB family XrtA/PEP-CTERM system-associated protein [Marinobacter adhaerens]|uniref:FemAB family XrtA/PEP-CTERM system-associated protein n=1 Tax=Marinobacter adhaerens TaxID=1033846 RepID=UPI003D2C885D
MSVEVRVFRLGQCPREELDRYLRKTGEAGPYHSISWLEAIEKAYRHPGRVIAAYRNDEVCGVLPLVMIKPPFIRPQLISLPFCDYGGPVADDDTIREQLLAAAKKLKSKEGINSAEIRVRSPAGESDTWTTGEKVRMILSLPGSSQALFASFKPKLRSQIRKAEKNGLVCNIGMEEELLRRFYNVFCDNMRRLGSPVHSLSFFQALRAAYGPRMVVAVVDLDGLPVGAGIVLLGNEEACIPWASTLAEYNHLAPNMLLYWRLLEWVSDSGATTFDFGRSSFGEGTFRFKKQWGARPEALRWHQLDKASDLDNPIVVPSDLKFRIRQWIVAGWQCLPLDLANWLGPKIRRYISL